MSLHPAQPAEPLPEHIRMHAVFSAGIDALEADPVAHFRFSSEGQRRYAEGMGQGLRVYLTGANKSGKTLVNAAWGVAAAQGRTHLDGVPMPAFPSPCKGMVMSLDYTQQRLSVQGAYLEMLGAWPHKAQWDGETLMSLRVKPIGSRSEDPRDWALIVFLSQKNLGSGVGARAHWVQFDEPPMMEAWRECLKAGYAGSPFSLGITGTPLRRSQWWPLRDYFPLTLDGRDMHGVVHHGAWLRLRIAVRENLALSEAEVVALEESYRNDPNRSARLLGLEVDTSGASPFHAHYAELAEWLDACRDGEVQEWKVQREVGASGGKELVTEYVDVEVWGEPVKGHVYRVVLDPSLGIDDGKHDPCEATVYDMTAGDEAAVYNGYIGGYGLGILGAGMSKHWNDAEVDPAVTGGYGGDMLTGLRVAGCRRVVSHRRVMPQGGLERTDVGFTENAATRIEHMTALREALTWSAAGAPFMRVRSRRQVMELMDLQVDEKDRPTTGPGLHDEALLTLGRIATLLKPTKPAPVHAEVPERKVSARESWRAQNGLAAQARLRGGARLRGNAPRR